MKRVLVTVTNYNKYCKTGRNMLLNAGFELILSDKNRPYAEDELLEISPNINAVVCGVDSWNVDVLNAAKNLKIISRFGVGTDNIDLCCAKEKGIHVTNVSGVNSSAVAEHAMTLLFATLRKIPFLDKCVRNQRWERAIFPELKGKTIGLIGFGNIAQLFAKYLSGFDVNLIAYDQNPNVFMAKKYNVTILNSMEEIFNKSDIISLHIPSTKATYNIINKETIALMKDGVILINTARGSIWNEKDIADGLGAKKIAAIGTDVYETEPIQLSCPFLPFDNAVMTPHIAAESYENYDESSRITAQAIIDVFNDKVPKNLLGI